MLRTAPGYVEVDFGFGGMGGGTEEEEDGIDVGFVVIVVTGNGM